MTNQELDRTHDCPECSGRTVEFTGNGSESQFRVCSRWKEPGHATRAEINYMIDSRRREIRPSGRFA